MKKNSNLGKLFEETIADLDSKKKAAEATEEHGQEQARKRQNFLMTNIRRLLVEKRAELAKVMSSPIVAKSVNRNVSELQIRTSGQARFDTLFGPPKTFLLREINKIHNISP